MATFPLSLDNSFPGWPYADYTEYVTAEQANSWISAIQAIETTIGYGTASTAANPLYSAKYNQTYATITARIANIENYVSRSIVGGLQLNTSASNIQPVGTVAGAGNSGLAADSKHVHAGVSPAGFIQIGMSVVWAGPFSTIPSGYFVDNGQLVSQSTYSSLFVALGSGSVYGTSGGSFYLPNFNDRFPIGVNSVAAAVGATGGSRTIATSNIPAHAHGVNDPSHTHGVNDPQHFHNLPPQTIQTVANTVGLAPTATNQASITNVFPTQNASTGISLQNATTGVSTQNAGGGQPYDQPYLGVYWIIRAL